MSVVIHIGDSRKVLSGLPSESVNCIVTSPPYYTIRDYGHEQQIGLEDTPDAFVDELVSVFREARRVLSKDGTLWLNIGDTSNNRRRIKSSSHQASLNGFEQIKWAEATRLGLTRLSTTSGGLKEKDTFGIPWMLAFALRADGWYLRQEIVWTKTFGKPEPGKDRLPYRHEQVFLLSKSKNYYFDKGALPDFAQSSVWVVPPVGRSDHSAAFSEKLVEPCIKAGCPEGGTVLDPFGGSGTTGVVAQRFGRKAVLIELNAEYARTAESRIEADAGIFSRVRCESAA